MRGNCSAAGRAAAVLASQTDLCSAFARCLAPNQHCLRPPPPVAAVRRAQTLYGVFRAAFTSRKNTLDGQRSVPLRARPQLATALARAGRALGPCSHLVIRRCREHIFAALAGLHSCLPAGQCLRVFVHEHCQAHRGQPRRLPRMDARDALYDVTRVAVYEPANPTGPQFDVHGATALLHFEWSSRAGMADTAPVTYFTDATRIDWLEASLSECRCRRFFVDLPREALATGAALVELPPQRLVKPHVALLVASVHSTNMSMRVAAMHGLRVHRLSGAITWRRVLETCSQQAANTVEPHRRVLAVLAMLINRAAQPMTPEPPTVPHLPGPPSWRVPQVAIDRPSRWNVPLACVDHDFMLHNRELMPAAVGVGRCTVHPRLSHDAARLREALETVQQTRPQAGGGCRTSGLLRTRLLPAGWLSTVHGVIKPLTRALRTGQSLLTPSVPEFVAPERCRRRDLSCFFAPLSACDGVADASVARVSTVSLEDDRFVRNESLQRPGALPRAFRAQDAFWWTSQLLSFVMRPSMELAHHIHEARTRTGLAAKLDHGAAVVGLHVRHGDACLGHERTRMARTCAPLAEYMPHVRAVAQQVGATTIYLATDSMAVLNDTRAFPEFHFLHLPGVLRSGLNGASGPQQVWDATVAERLAHNSTGLSQDEARFATIDVALLAQCHAFVGKFTSTLFRTAYALRSASCDCLTPFVSLDAPWCSDYGVRSGQNWEFPLAKPLARNRETGRTQNRFWC